MSMGKRIAREIKNAKNSNHLDKITTWKFWI
jgi:5-formaminoimidazole-4-carboxamide-1-beta-D-ribofuranosyl 5'-monophosphate synthetase